MIGMCCVIMSVAIWLLLATALEMPVSTTHSCIGGVIGMALAAKGRDAVNWEKVGMVIASWFISPILSAIIAGLIYAFVRTFVLRNADSVERAYKMYPILIGVTKLTYVAAQRDDMPATAEAHRELHALATKASERLRESMLQKIHAVRKPMYVGRLRELHSVAHAAHLITTAAAAAATSTRSTIRCTTQ